MSVTTSIDQYEDLPLAPLDAKTEANRRAIREPFLTVGVVYDEGTEPAAGKDQFSLRQMMLIQTCLAILFGLMQLFAPSFVAGALGISVLGLATLVSVCQPEDRRIQYAWWAIFAFYIIACVVAVIRG